MTGVTNSKVLFDSEQTTVLDENKTNLSPTSNADKVAAPISANLQKKLKLQKLAGRIFVLPLSLALILLLKSKLKYKVESIKQIRRQFFEICKLNKPFIICANHLTLIDSIIMLWALASPFTYFFRYRMFSWNFPASENAKRKLSWRIITFLNKCILVDRLGNQEHTGNLVDQMAYLLQSGENCMIFPEGTRSRIGRVNPELVNYGVGKILQRLPDCHVLCIYLRSDKQENFSDFPAKDSNFKLQLEFIKPTSTQAGLRGARDLANQVINKLKDMEDVYFAKNTAS